MIKVKVWAIKWDTSDVKDCDPKEIKLPSVVELSFKENELLEKAVEQKLAREYGFTTDGFNMEVKRITK